MMIIDYDDDEIENVFLSFCPFRPQNILSSAFRKHSKSLIDKSNYSDLCYRHIHSET